MSIHSLRRYALGFVCVLSWSLVPAALHAQVTLKHVVPAGKTVRSSIDSSTEQSLMLLGQNQETKSEQNTVHATIYSPVENGKVTATHKVEALQVRLKVQGMDVSFDSANPDKESDSELGKLITKPLQATLKASWTSVHESPSGKVVEVKGADKFIEGLDPQSAAMVKAQLDPEFLKQKLSQDMERIPSKPIKAGDTWELSREMRIGGGQSLTFKVKYKYGGTVTKDGKQLHRIESTVSEVAYSIGADSPLPLKVKNSDLKAAESKGELLFDNSLGRIVEDTDKLRIKGKITFEVMGQELPGDLDLTITASNKERP